MKKSMLILAVILVGCSLPDEVGMPSWTTNLRLFFVNDSWQSTELANDSTLVVNDGILEFHDIAVESEAIELLIESMEHFEPIELGEISINQPSDRDESVVLSDFIPESIPPNLPIPQFILKEAILEFTPFSEFETVTFSAGIMPVTITNNTLVPLGDVNNNAPFNVEIYNYQTDDSLFTITFDDIDLGESQTKNVELNGKTFPNTIGAKINGGSSGSNGEIVDVNATVDVNIQMLDVAASQVVAPIPLQNLAETFKIGIDEDVVVYQAIMDSSANSLDLVIENGLDLTVNAEISIENFKLANEETDFVLNLVIPRNGEYISNINLNGAQIGTSENSLDSLVVTVTAFTDSTLDAREINSNDDFSVDISVSELSFSSIYGIIKPFAQDEIADEIEIDFNYPSFTEGTTFTGNTTITFRIDSPIYAIAEDIEFTAHSNTESDTLKDNSGNLPTFEINPGFNEIIWNSDEYNINALLSIWPENIEYSIVPIIGSEEQIVELFLSDEISMEIEITSQLAIQTDTDGVWFVLENDDDTPTITAVNTTEFDDEKFDAFQNGKIVIEYINTTGVQVVADILIAKDSLQIFEFIYEYENTPDSLIFVSDSLLFSAESQFFEIELAQADLEMFIADSVFVGSRINVYSNGLQPFGGGVEIIGELQLEIKINEDLVED